MLCVEQKKSDDIHFLSLCVMRCKHFIFTETI